MIAAIVALVAAIMQPRAASCPDRAWMEGIASSGRYRCYVTGGTLEQNDPPHTLVRSGRLWCLSDETPMLVDHRRARCRRGRRTFKTDRVARRLATERRAELRAEGLCINGRDHGPATHGVRCGMCRLVHRGEAARRAKPQRTACVNGHPYNERDTHVDATGRKSCRICNRLRMRVTYAEREMRREGRVA